jgi:hypothetical protein
MSEAKPKRKFWQFHLSTAVLLILLAGGLLWLQLCDYLAQRQYAPLPPGIFASYGWPVLAYKFEYNFYDQGSSVVQESVHRWKPLGVAVDALVALGVLVCAASFSEFLIRRREVRET